MKTASIISCDKRKRLCIHQDDDCSPNYVQGLNGFDDQIGEDCTTIQFQHDFRIHRETIIEMNEKGCSLQSFFPMIVYHKHVWWYYGYKLELKEEDVEHQVDDQKKQEKDVETKEIRYFSFLLENIGTSMKNKKDVPKGGLGNNIPTNQKAPRAERVLVRLGVKTEDEFKTTSETSLKPDIIHNGYSADKIITQSDMDELTAENVFIIFRVSLEISKSYFDIDKLVGLVTRKRRSLALCGNNLLSAFTFSKHEIDTIGKLETRDLLEEILKGNKSANSDFVFIRGNSSCNDSSVYHVHQKVLAARSVVLANIIREKFSPPTDQMLVLDAEDRIIFPHLTELEIKMILTYLYTSEVTIPQYDSFARVGRLISILLEKMQLRHIISEWQAAIVMNVLRTEKMCDVGDTLEESLKALVAVFSVPYGAMPYAKKVALSSLANLLATNDVDSLEKYGDRPVVKIYGHLFFERAYRLKRLIAAVKKTPMHS